MLFSPQLLIVFVQLMVTHGRQTDPQTNRDRQIDRQTDRQRMPCAHLSPTTLEHQVKRGAQAELNTLNTWPPYFGPVITGGKHSKVSVSL